MTSKKIWKKLVGEKLIGAASHSFSMGNSKIESENSDSTSSAISLFLSDIAEEVEIYASLAT